MTAYLVVEQIDPTNRSSAARWRVSPLTLTANFVTAANAMAPTLAGSAAVSAGGIPRMYYEGDIISSTVDPISDADVRGNWALTSQTTGNRPSKQKIAAPYLTGNIAPGTFIRALLSSTAWAAYIAAATDADFGLLDNFGNASPVLLGAVATVRQTVAPREKTVPVPTPRLGGHLVTSIRDSQGQGGNFRIRVTPLTLTSTWVTAAQAVLAAVYGSAAVSHAGYVRAYLEQDILTSPIAAQPNTNVRFKWVMKARATGHPSFQMNIAAPLVAGNLVAGEEIIADLNSTEWVAFLATLTATHLGWISNDGTASPIAVGATSAAVARKNPRQRVR
jgi:hypothetical protein